MSITRRIPKRGFSNAPFRRRYDIVNLTVLVARFEADEVVSLEALEERGILKSAYGRLKILGTGELTKPLKIMAHRLSASAQKKVDAAGGSVEVLKFTGAKGRQKAAAGKGSQPSTGGS